MPDTSAPLSNDPPLAQAAQDSNAKLNTTVEDRIVFLEAAIDHLYHTYFGTTAKATVVANVEASRTK